MATGFIIKNFSGFYYSITDVAFSPDGTKLLFGTGGYSAELRDASTGLLLRTFTGHIYNIKSVAFSPDGSKVLTGSDDGATRLWDISDLSAIVHKTGSPNNSPAAFKVKNNNAFIFTIPLKFSHQRSILSLYSISGRRIAKYHFKNHSGRNTFQCAFPENIGQGIYLYRFENSMATFAGAFSILK